MNNVAKAKNYIRTLQLNEPKFLLKPELLFGGPVVTQSYEAYVDHSSLVAFDREINDKYRNDVLNSQLLAQLAADKHAKRETIEWYRKYQEVLTSIGWIIKKSTSGKDEIVGNKMTVQKVILGILTTIIPGVNAVQLIGATLGALEGLAAKDGRIKLFEKSSHTEYAANFQVSTSYEAGNGLETALCIICLTSEAKITSLIGVDLSSIQAKLKYRTQIMELNENAYDAIREQINFKLKDAMGAVSGIQI